jgi:hypothetical protein
MRTNRTRCAAEIHNAGSGPKRMPARRASNELFCKSGHWSGVSRDASSMALALSIPILKEKGKAQLLAFAHALRIDLWIFVVGG